MQRNTAHFDLNDKNLDSVRFVKVNSFPAVREHVTTEFYIVEVLSHGVYESSLLRLDPDEKKLDEHDSIIINSTLTSSKTKTEIATKSNVKSLHESSKNRRDLTSFFNDKDNEFDKKTNKFRLYYI